MIEEKEICQLEDSDDEDTNNDIQCNMENRCSAYAACTWNGLNSKYECVCNPGYHGDGIDCREKDLSCVDVRRNFFIGFINQKTNQNVSATISRLIISDINFKYF